MADHFKKVQTGQKLAIPAAAYNSFIDAAQNYQSRCQNSLQYPILSNGQANFITVKNVTGSDVPRFGVLAIGEPVISPTDNMDEFMNRIAITGVMPEETEHLGKFIITVEPIASGQFGWAIIAGITIAKVLLENSSQEVKFASIIDSDTTSLQPSESGAAQVLWHEQITGNAWAIVRLGCPSTRQVMFGKPTTEFTGGVSITLDPCDLSGTDNGQANVTVYVKSNKSNYTMTNSTSINTTQIVLYISGDNGEYYMLGSPIEVVTTYQIDGVNRKFLKKTRNVWVLTTGSESDLVDVHLGDNCPT